MNCSGTFCFNRSFPDSHGFYDHALTAIGEFFGLRFCFLLTANDYVTCLCVSAYNQNRSPRLQMYCYGAETWAPAPRSLNALPSLHPQHPIRHTENDQPFHPNPLRITQRGVPRITSPESRSKRSSPVSVNHPKRSFLQLAPTHHQRPRLLHQSESCSPTQSTHQARVSSGSGWFHALVHATEDGTQPRLQLELGTFRVQFLGQ
jgi:hypothetical protein